MNCIREAENLLRYYRDLKRSVENNRRLISKLTYGSGPKAMGAAKLDPTGIRADRPHDALNQMYQLQTAVYMVGETEQELEHIDAVLDAISNDRGCERYKELLLYWYVEKMPKEEIAEVMGYSQRTSVYDIRNKAIAKFAASFFGITAVRAY